MARRLPRVAAKREVEEETGLAVRELVLLLRGLCGCGRLNNRLFGFFALVDGSARVDRGRRSKRCSFPSGRIRAMAAEGEIAIAANIGLLYLAGYHPRVRAICGELGLRHPPWMDD